MSRQIGVILLGLALMGLVGLQTFAHAQNTTPIADSRDQGDRTTDRESGDTIFQQDENGIFRRVPLESLKRATFPPNAAKTEDDTAESSDFFFSKLALDGTANEEWVELTASLTIRVVAVDRWVNVPVRFDQASLLDFKHSGPGDITVPAIGHKSRGLSWLLRGAGDHQLKMMLRVPLRKTPAGDLLQLELPEMVYFIGELTLQLPSSSVTIRTEDNVRLLGTRVEGEHTFLTAELPGDRIDLHWNFHEQQTEPLMQKPTEIQLRLLEEGIELTARQQIQLGANYSDSLRVRLPSEKLDLNSEGVRIVDGNGNERWIQPTSTDQPEWVTLPLGHLAGNLVQLNWNFSTPMPEDGREIVIDGFEVEKARRQLGTISVESLDGFRVTQVGEDDIGVERIDVDDLPTSSTLSSQAYSFTGAQYRLRLRVEPAVPVVSVTPYYFVKVSQDRVELEAIYQLSVDGGVVRSLPVIWSDEDRESWDVVASSLTGGLPRKTRPENADAPDEWELTLPNVVDNRVEVGLSAVRYFDTYPPDETIALSLPILSEARGLSGWVVVSTDDDVEVTTRADEFTILTRQSDTALDTLKIPGPDWTNTQPLTPYRFSSNRPDAPPQLELDLTVQSQTVTTSTVIEVHDLDDQPRVSQRLSYDVQFGRLSQVRLKIPPLLYDQLTPEFADVSLKFLLDGEVPLTTVWSGSEVTVALPTPRLGKFDIVVDDYSSNRDQEIFPATFDVPIISSLDQLFSSVRLIVPDQPTLSINVDDEDWTRITTVADGMQWITGQPVEDVSIALDRSLEQSPQRLKIDTAFLQTVIDDAGHRVTHAKYVIQDSIDELVLKLPANAANPSFKWNGKALDDSNVTRPSGDQQFRVERPPNPLSLPQRSSPQIVSLSYQSPVASVHWSEAQTVSFPVFAPGVWIEQMWWELKLPPAQHLFVPPSSMTPQFQWEREGIFWERQPVANYDEFRDSILGTDATDQAASTNSGSDYPFVTLGSPTEVRFRTMSKSGIVFLGAGLTLIASFLLLKVPAARHPLIWLAVGFAVMVSSLWYLEPMLLLLQPAAYGLLLPICAAILEYIANGRRLPIRRSIPDSTYREVGSPSDSGFSGTSDPPVTSTLVRPTAMSNSGTDA